MTLVAQGASIVRAAVAFRRTTVSVRTRARSLGCPFPTLRVATGTSFFLDVSDSLAGDGGSITVTFEFDAVKRRKLAA